jgi:hypothetical protein
MVGSKWVHLDTATVNRPADGARDVPRSGGIIDLQSIRMALKVCPRQPAGYIGLFDECCS